MKSRTADESSVPAKQANMDNTSHSGRKPAQRLPLDIAADENQPLGKRLAAIDGLGNDLSSDDVEKVASLMFKTGEDETLRNECANTILKQQKPVDMMGQLIESHLSEKETRTWVDYSAQFIPGWYPLCDEESRAKAVEVLKETATGDDPGIAVTAMISLQRISEIDPKISSSIEAIARGKLAHKDPELSAAAMNIAMRRGDTTVLPIARHRAMKTGEILQRLSDIAALGQLGDASDVNRLETLLKDKDSRVRRVAGYQLRQLRRRLGRNTKILTQTN